MLKIGEFSRLSQVTVKTLHHYDDIGLLKPSHVDRFTKHRYYALEQLPHVHRIMTLKELGLSLEQISKMVDSELSIEHLRGMLALKEAEVQQGIDEEQTRLKRIRFHIRQIDLEAEMSNLDIVIKKVDPVRALTMRLQGKTQAEILHYGGSAMPVFLESGLVEMGGMPTVQGKYIFQIVYAKEVSQTNLDIELVLPVSDSWKDDLSIPNAGTWILREVDGIEQAATYIYNGTPITLANPLYINENLVDLERWVVANGYKLSNEVRTVTLRMPAQLPQDKFDYDQWVGEIQHSLEKA
jgi:DNA-binding transcriptional MerR regulator